MTTVSPDYRTRYGSTSARCGCPARAFSSSKVCKHMELEATLEAIQEEKERAAAIARSNILARYGSTLTICSCDEWIDSREGALDAGGECEHTRWLKKHPWQAADHDPFACFG